MKHYFDKVIEIPWLIHIIIGVVLFVAAANGGLTQVNLKFDSIGRVASAVLGLVFIALGILSYLRGGDSKTANRLATDRVRIDGEYHTSDTHGYRISIIPLPGDFKKDDVDYYRISHADWNGVGFFDGEFFYSAFHINDKATPADRRGNWGAHLARFSARNKSFEVFMVELKEQQHYDERKGVWIRENDNQ